MFANLQTAFKFLVALFVSTHFCRGFQKRIASILHVPLHCVEKSDDVDAFSLKLDQNSDVFRNFYHNTYLRSVDCTVPPVMSVREESVLHETPVESLQIANSLSQAVDIDTMRDADLVWIEVQNRDLDLQRQVETASAILQWLQRQHVACSSNLPVSPVRIVSSLRGRPAAVLAPLLVRGDEGRTHVPLWIDHGVSHACRIQSHARKL